MLHQIGHHRPHQPLEGRCVAEKAGHVNEKVLHELFELTAVLAQHAYVGRNFLGRGSCHPAPSPSEQGVRRCGPEPGGDIGVAGIADQRLRNLPRR